jgi:DNA-binding transcriptional LysR family regulator
MINPAHLDLFRAVMRHGGMTRAAGALGICEPHVSRAMTQLEAKTGLFVCRHGTARRGASGSA